jgi:hypothetical protein
MEQSSVTSHCFRLTSRHAARSTRPVRKVTRGQAMSGHIITIIALQHFLKNDNTSIRLMICLSLNKLCLPLPNQSSPHYHACIRNYLNEVLIFPSVLFSSTFLFSSYYLSSFYFIPPNPPLRISLTTDPFIHLR